MIYLITLLCSVLELIGFGFWFARCASPLLLVIWGAAALVKACVVMTHWDEFKNGLGVPMRILSIPESLIGMAMLISVLR